MNAKNLLLHNSTFQKLDWDTTQLGVPTAKITRISPDILEDARKAGIKLLYFVSPTETQADGILVDQKVTYIMDLKKSLLPVPDIETYTGPLTDELLQLAYESGKYSRFRNDPNLTENQFKNIYREWITNSVNHTIADDVLVIRENKTLLGMVTVGDKNGRGDIGLLAVDENARGKQIGTKLVHAAQHYFIQKNYKQSQVVTQQENIAACKLYEKCGYHIEKVEYFYHVWV